MNKKKIKTGIVGSGFAASFHYEALLKVYGTEIEVTGVYSPTRAKRDAFAQKRGLRAFDELDQILDQSDVIHVCTPPSTHESIAISALQGEVRCRRETVDRFFWRRD